MTQGKILGVMSACNKRKGTFTIKVRDFLVAVANLVALILTSHTK
jgi:hypothetical protein